MKQEEKIFEDLTKLGKFLKEHRLLQGKKLKDISRTLMIKENILSNFERGNVNNENFNNNSYLRGFLNSYIKYLKLDNICKLNLVEKKIISNLEKSNLQLEMSKIKKNSYGSILVLFSLILLGLIYLIWSKNTYHQLYIIGISIN